MYHTKPNKHLSDWFAGNELSAAKSKAWEFLREHYDRETMEQIRDAHYDSDRQRAMVICKLCQDEMRGCELRLGEVRRCDLAVDPWTWVDDGDGIRVQERWHEHFQEGSGPVSSSQQTVVRPQLGLPLHQLAPPLAALTDFEEMVLALVHPLVQVYTIPTTGELAYVGHVCNFRQKVSKFLSSIPVQKDGFPGMVVVKPRQVHGQGSKRMPFPVNVLRLRAAFD